MKTAVEWLEDFMNNGKQKSEGIISLAFAKAKQMEKERMCECYNEGLYQDIHSDTLLPFEQYYNETFKSE